MLKLPPLSLYIHIPWCARKCPYCDFNSHAQNESVEDLAYVEALLQDLRAEQRFVAGREVQSLFIGGGTPSLFSTQSIKQLLAGIAELITLDENLEITLEANPGAMESERLPGYREAGVNRLSLGVQSLNADSLQALGRIHGPEEVFVAVDRAQRSGFERINLDLMFGLPFQTQEMAQADLRAAIGLAPGHLSYYQLTLEPNTPFYYSPPALPDEESLWQMQQTGHEMLQQAGYEQYEISAFSRPDERCRHNINYWRFGDYIGIGAGAHSKITTRDGVIKRHWKWRHPNDYLAAADGTHSFIQGEHILQAEDLSIEFMMNALRLTHGVEASLFSVTTGLGLETIQVSLQAAIEKGLLYRQNGRIRPTPLGFRFLNDLISMFEVKVAT
jgi:oxygen-independent coproporphyrinogen-3 oxidase